jgi:alanine dehydrogenase
LQGENWDNEITTHYDLFGKKMQDNSAIRLGANVLEGKATYRAVADAFGLEYTSIDTFLS